jgi:hypothetical protein
VLQPPFIGGEEGGSLNNASPLMESAN